MNPFNIDLLIIDNSLARQLKPVTELGIMETNTKNFNTKGLFSTEIFGQVGSPERNTTFSYIDLKIKILHPLVYKHLSTMKTLYKGIMEGRLYGVWDKSLSDIVQSDSENGETGLEFMLKYVKQIKFSNNGSIERSFKIKIIEKYSADDMLLDKWLVLPAGLRDYTIDNNDKPTEDEVNDLYRRLLMTVNVLNNISINKNNSVIINPIRIKLQNITLEIYDYFRTLTDGKKKFIESKWSKRAITYGTRNVITALPTIPDDIDTENKVSFNDTVIGLYQFISGISPITKNKVISKFINKIMDPTSDMATLVDMKTLKSVYTDVDASKKNDWFTDEGLDGIIGKMGQEILRNEPIVIDGYYLMLIYDDGKNIQPIFNTDTINENLNEKYIRPITYAELFYISIYDVRKKYPAFLTRYPVANLGGVYPTKLYVKTTNNGRTVNITMNGITSTMYEYPTIGDNYYNSLSPHITKLAGLEGDYDGDTVGLNILYTDESISEINKLLDKKEFYLTPDGKIQHSSDSDTISLVLKHMTII